MIHPLCETISYENIVSALNQSPTTWLPALLKATVVLCEEKSVFRPGQISLFVRKIETGSENEPTSGKELLESIVLDLQRQLVVMKLDSDHLRSELASLNHPNKKRPD